MIYCDVELSDLNLHNPKIKVCSGYDAMSRIDYKELIQRNEHSYFTQRAIEVIRWLYRGMSYEMSVNRAKNLRNIKKEFIHKACFK